MWSVQDDPDHVLPWPSADLAADEEQEVDQRPRSTRALRKCCMQARPSPGSRTAASIGAQFNRSCSSFVAVLAYSCISIRLGILHSHQVMRELPTSSIGAQTFLGRSPRRLGVRCQTTEANDSWACVTILYSTSLRLRAKPRHLVHQATVHDMPELLLVIVHECIRRLSRDAGCASCSPRSGLAQATRCRCS